MVSNFGNLMQSLIPSMTTELETAFSISISEEKKVSEAFWATSTHN